MRPDLSKRRRIGFFGCADQVVRVALRHRPGRYPAKVWVACPACGHEHDAAPLWREWNEKLDRDKELTYAVPYRRELSAA